MSINRKQLNPRQELMRDFAESAAIKGEHFFYIRIHESLRPIERAEKYEDPLEEALGELGHITGGGSQLGKDDSIEYCGIDIVVNDRDHGLRVIRKCLRACGAPPNTVIEEYEPEFNELPL
jgi:hypothetical protein